MDSRNPYSQSSGYIGLLNSQHKSVVHENFSYISFHGGGFEIPAFSSQRSEVPTPPEDTPVERREREKWTPADDKLLISAWLNTSKDAIVGNEQKSGTFWKRVGDYYSVNSYPRTGGEKKELHCKQRWHKINDVVSKFCSSFAAAERRASSGQNDNDVIAEAHDIYHSDYNVRFNLDHAWCLLRHDQKWLSLNPPKTTDSSKRKSGEDVSQSSTANVCDDDIRPEGIKAAKAKRNSAQGKALDDYKSMWEIKREKLAMKEKLSMLAILDTLLSKRGPLSEAEEVVKNKVKEQMGQGYSYTQPSDSEGYDYSLYSGSIQREADILEDQSLLSQSRREAHPIQYPPQPEVEFGFPKSCYCGGEPLLDTSYTRNDPGRRFFTCENRDDGECYVWKWWDVAAMEEIRAMETQNRVLADKVDSLTCSTDYETELQQLKLLHNDTEQKFFELKKIVCGLGKKQSITELLVGVTAFVMVVIAVILMF